MVARSRSVGFADSRLQLGRFTLVINCPDLTISWSVLNEVVAIATTLESFAKSAKIRISPPVSKGEPFEIRVDELDIYQE